MRSRRFQSGRSLALLAFLAIGTYHIYQDWFADSDDEDSDYEDDYNKQEELQKAIHGVDYEQIQIKKKAGKETTTTEGNESGKTAVFDLSESDFLTILNELSCRHEHQETKEEPPLPLTSSSTDNNESKCYRFVELPPLTSTEVDTCSSMESSPNNAEKNGAFVKIDHGDGFQNRIPGTFQEGEVSPQYNGLSLSSEEDPFSPNVMKPLQETPYPSLNQTVMEHKMDPPHKHKVKKAKKASSSNHGIKHHP